MEGINVEQINLIQLLVNGGFAALAVFLVVENRKDAQRREDASLRRESTLLNELHAERNLRAQFQIQVTSQFEAIAKTLERIEKSIESRP